MASTIESSSNANPSIDIMNCDKSKPQFSKIIISLENCVLPNEVLDPTPSMKDGLDYEHEIDLRLLGCELIQVSGILLKLPQVAMATGQVLFQRYYYCKSLVRFQMEVTAMACVTLATKIEEAPRRIRDVINVFHHMKQNRLNDEIKPLILDDSYVNLKNQVIKAERRLLKELGFCVHVKHPHKIIVTLLQVLDNEKSHHLMQTSWNYMNDSLRTNVFVRYSPETIACSCIYLSARVLRIPLPSNPHWFEIFRVTEEEIQDVCESILNLYTRQKPNQEQLEKIIDGLRKDHENAKLKAKSSATENGTVSQNEQSPSSSRATSPVSKTKASANSPSKSSQKSIPSLVCHANSPNKKRPIESSPLLSKRSKSRSDSPIDRNTNHYEKNERIDRDRERERTPPKLYSSYNKDIYSRSRPQSRDKDRSHHHHHKHKRITYSRSRSRSPAPPHSHYNYHSNSNSHYNSKYYLINNTNRKSRKRSKSPNDRNSYHSRSRRSRSRELY